MQVRTRSKVDQHITAEPRSSAAARVWRMFGAVLLFLMIYAGAAASGVQAQTVEEHDAKAAFLYKLMNFVQWPDSNGDLVIGFVGAESTGDSLQRLAYGKPVNGRKIVVRRLQHDGDLKSCRVIYVGASEARNSAAMLDRLRGSNVLTVGESSGFGQHGGVVNLMLNEGRIRFEVNPHAAERAHLQISSRLLALATIVGDGN